MRGASARVALPLLAALLLFLCGVAGAVCVARGSRSS
jgi:hypothetical protein